MKGRFRIPRRANDANALILALIVVVVITSLIGVAVLRTASVARISARASNFSAEERAADGVLEYGYGVWKAATVAKDAPLVTTVSADNAILNTPGPAIPGFTYVSPLQITPLDIYGNPTTSPAGVIASAPGYPGWQGVSYNYAATVQLHSTNGPASLQPQTAGLKRIFQYVSVSLFQATYFYQDDLELFQTAPMVIGGLVHTNGRLLASMSGSTAVASQQATASNGVTTASGDGLTFLGNVSYSGGNATTPGYSSTQAPLDSWITFNYGTQAAAQAAMYGPIYSNGGVSQQVSYVNPMQPFGGNVAPLFSSGSTNPNISDGYHELIDPPNPSYTDPPQIASRRFYNKAGIVVTINAGTVSVASQNGTSLTTANIAALQKAYTGQSTFYDQREQKNVDVDNIDVSQLTTLFNGNSTGFNGVLYVQDITPATATDPNPKTVRLMNGGILPDAGLTVASQNPVYIQGDYNTGEVGNPTAVPANATGNATDTDSPVVSGYTRKPAAVIGDAIMFLSNSWVDGNSTQGLTGRIASNTTYNTAIIAGIVPSGYDPDGSGPIPAYGYSGGANNLPRFLENWAGYGCTYYGSMVELYTSKTFNGQYVIYGNVYGAPNRSWNYDTNFNTSPPPGSSDAVIMSRGTWMKY